MKQSQEIISNFAVGLQSKDIKLISSCLSETCEWYTGQHFGMMKGRIACLNHIKVIFSSFRHLNFILEQTAATEKVSVLEYAFLPKEKSTGFLKPSDYSGVFIIKINKNKIQNIKTYYEDRTLRPRRIENSLIKTDKPLPSKPLDYDPVTGLPFSQ